MQCSSASPAQSLRNFLAQASVQIIPPSFTDVSLFPSFWHECATLSLYFVHLKKIQPSTLLSINCILLPELEFCFAEINSTGQGARLHFVPFLNLCKWTVAQMRRNCASVENEYALFNKMFWFVLRKSSCDSVTFRFLTEELIYVPVTGVCFCQQQSLFKKFLYQSLSAFSCCFGYWLYTLKCSKQTVCRVWSLAVYMLHLGLVMDVSGSVLKTGE